MTSKRTSCLVTLLCLLLLLYNGSLGAQVTIGIDKPAKEGVILDLKNKENSTDGTTSDKGLGMPRVALQKTSSLEPCTNMSGTNGISHIGLTVYNTASIADVCPGLYVWEGKWTRLDDIKCQGQNLTLNKYTMTIEIGDKEKLFHKILPPSALQDVTWASAGTTIATVDNKGVVEGITIGTTKVTASAVKGGMTADCDVNVVSVPLGITLNKNTTTLASGGTETLIATITPANAADKRIKWSSSDPSKVSVDDNGMITGIVDTSTPITITATTVKGNFSATCMVTVCTPPRITTEVETIDIAMGDPFTMSVTAVGTNIKYQWNHAGTDIVGATSSSYHIASSTTAHEGIYTCTVTGDCGTAVQSTGSVSICVPPTIVTHPISQNLTKEDELRLSIVATGTSNTYQWYKGADKIDGATNDTYIVNSVDPSHADSYTCKVTGIGKCNSSVTSNIATVTVCVPPYITDHTVQRDLTVGDALNLSVDAGGTGISYQWHKNWQQIPGATTSTYTIANVSAADADSYYCIIAGDCGQAGTPEIFVTVCVPPAITVQPVGDSKNVGQDFHMSVGASGTKITSYQWFRDGVAVGTDSNELYIASVTKGDIGTYTCVVTAECGTATSLGAVLNVCAPANIHAQPEDRNLTEGETLNLSVGATGDVTGYQWYHNDEAIGGANSATYSVTGVNASHIGTYRCDVYATCGNATSNTVNVSVCIVITDVQTTISLSPSVLVGGSFTIAAFPTGDGITYTWYKDGQIVQNDSPANSYTVNNAQLSHAGNYAVVVKNSCTPGGVSKEAGTITVLDISGPPVEGGKLNGKTRYDVGMINDGGDCGTLAVRQIQRHDFSLNNVLPYLFDINRNVSNLSIYYVNVEGTVITGVDYNKDWNTASVIYGENQFTVKFNPNLNEEAKGRTRENPLKAHLIAVYNLGPGGSGEVVRSSIEITIMDCNCCGAKTVSGGWINFMCYNLGANEQLDAFTHDQRLGGDYYQWGRHADGHQKRNSPVVAGPVGYGELDANGQISPSSGYYGKFITSATNWRPNGIDTWGYPKMPADPCPAGWRVPTIQEWASIFDGKVSVENRKEENAIANKWTWTGKAGALSWQEGSYKIGNYLLIPAFGYRGSTGVVGAGGSNNGAYLSSTPHPTNTWSFGTFSFSKYMFGQEYISVTPNGTRSQGASVRCVADE